MPCSNEESIELIGGPKDGLEVEFSKIIRNGEIVLTVNALLAVNKDVEESLLQVAEYVYKKEESKYFFSGRIFDTDDSNVIVDPDCDYNENSDD